LPHARTEDDIAIIAKTIRCFFISSPLTKPEAGRKRALKIALAKTALAKTALAKLCAPEHKPVFMSKNFLMPGRVPKLE
jgi:hypothetical protein